jgi:ElaB/YqjD/DUF883 family membrane-anchored ribosome-binding protein
MAEERNLGVARAPENLSDDDATKAELQRRMEEARESISQTVTEIKDTVSNQYQNVRESINEALDWKEHYRKRPVAFTVGALSFGFLLGYGLTGALKNSGKYESESYSETGSEYNSFGSDIRSSTSYSPQSITGDTGMSTGISYEPEKPGIIQKFKETKAYDRLQEEISNLGDRFVDELANVARTAVLPALLSKVKDFIGVDLNTQDSSTSRTQNQSRTPVYGNPTSSSSTDAATNRANYDNTRRADAYSTSENVGYSPS